MIFRFGNDIPKTSKGELHTAQPQAFVWFLHLGMSLYKNGFGGSGSLSRTSCKIGVSIAYAK